MRKVRLISMLAVLALVGAACSDSGSSGGVASGGTFVVARTQDIDNLDPHVSTAFSNIQTLGVVYETLINTDDQLNPAPGLAESWELSPDAKSITFELRDGVTLSRRRHLRLRGCQGDDRAVAGRKDRLAGALQHLFDPQDRNSR